MNMLMEFQGTRAVVLGLGTTGLSLVRHLVRHGAEVRVADTRTDPPNRAVLAAEFPRVALTTGPFTESTFDGAQLIAISPGVDPRAAPIRAAVDAGVEIVARALPADQKVLAITGTNGKTTVASLTGALAAAAGLTTVVAGNIGNAVLDELARREAGEPWPQVFVLEL